MILAALGLRSGQGANAFAWAEADGDVAALLRAYPDAAMLRRVAEIIRGWKDEDPRALWERLRAERKARAGAEGVARYVQLATSNRLIPGAFAADGRWVNAARDGGSHTDGGVSFGGSDFATAAETNADACNRLAEYATIAASNRLINVADDGTGDLRNTGAGGTTFGGREFATPPGEVAERFEGLAATVAAHVVEHAGTHPGGADFRGLHINRPNVDGFIPSREGLVDRFEGMARDVAEHAYLADGAFRQGEPTSGYRDDVRQAERGNRGEPMHGADRLQERFESMAADIATTGLLGQWSYRRGQPDSGFNAGLLMDREPTETGGNGAKARTCEQEAGLWTPAAGAPGWPPVTVLSRIPEAGDVAEWLGTPGDLEGCVVYSDPPYENTTGYRDTLSRAEVVRFALAYAALGAVVCVSEAEAIPELAAAGWYTTEVTGGRKGQRRTFARVATEWITMNRTPAHRVATQPALFGAR